MLSLKVGPDWKQLCLQLKEEYINNIKTTCIDLRMQNHVLVVCALRCTLFLLEG